jgi:transketolase
MNLAEVQRRILRLLARHRLCHAGSCLSAAPILFELYRDHGDERIILSCGHAGVALYAILEARFGFDAEQLLARHGVHPVFDPLHRIYCSTGSLGMGLAIGLGYALAGRRTHVVISDGECAEGIVWETLAAAAAFARDRPLDLAVHVNANGWSALGPVDLDQLERRLREFWPVHFHRTGHGPLPGELADHYRVLTEEEAETYAARLC